MKGCKEKKRKPGRPRKYGSDLDYAVAKRVRYHSNEIEAAQHFGIPAGTVSAIMKRTEQLPVWRQFKAYAREGHTAKLEELVCRVLMAMDPEGKAKEAFQLSYTHKNLFGDLQLLQGLPTEIHAHLIDHRDRLREAREKIIRSLPTEVQKALGEGKRQPPHEQEDGVGANAPQPTQGRG